MKKATTSCNVCVFESRNKWEMAACFCCSVRWVIPCEKHLYDIITHLFATKRNMWHIQKPASRMFTIVNNVSILNLNMYINQFFSRQKSKILLKMKYNAIDWLGKTYNGQKYTILVKKFTILHWSKEKMWIFWI